MIKNPEQYDRGRNGGIKTTVSVVVVCDSCGDEWSTQYSNYKKKKNKTDMCMSCRNRSGICGMLGKKHSKNTKDKFKRRKGEANPFYGKTHSEEQKHKWSKYRTGRPCRSNPVSIQERRKRSKISKAYWFGLTEEEKVARLSNCDYSSLLKATLKNGGRYSKLHQKVKNEMESFGFSKFQSEERIGGYVVDEVCFCSKVIVEINGDYWHANPKLYKPNEIIAYPKGLYSAVSIWRKDRQRTLSLEKMGYKVFVVWENDIKHGNHLSVFKEIKNAM